MGIYRGAGGSGDAVNDASSEALITIQARDAALAAQVAAEAAQTAAELAETNAETAETNAETAETNAETAATNAANSASAASTSASNAANSASAASTSASNASTSASNAASSASAASTSASNAASSASTASTQATNASNSASAASTSATNASNSASAAATSATNAANSATAAQTAQTAAELAETNAETAETNAETAETNAAASASAAATSASNASTSASNAATSATNASNSASAAATSATNASNSASAASTSATNASNSASAAATSASNAAASYDSFDDRYLGAKSSAPTLDNDGNTLLVGALYFNTSTNEMKVWSGSAWLNAYASLSGALLATNNLSDLNNTATARDNLGVEIGVDVQAYDAQLADIAGLTPTDNNFIVGNGTNFVTESGSTARTSLGLGSIATQDANNVAVTGGSINGTTVGASTPSTGSFTSLTDSGNLTFTGTGNRITGDFSNATIANNVAFQSSTTNGGTQIRAIPNGTSVSTSFQAINNSDPTNASLAQIACGGGLASIRSDITGTGTYLPLTMFTGGSERLRIDTSGKVLVGLSTSGSTASKFQVTGGTTNATSLATSYSDATVAIVPKSTSGFSLAIASGTNDFPQLQVSANGAAAGALLLQPYGGDVGIGTSSPSYPLNVVGSSNSVYRQVAIRNTSNGSGAYSILNIGNDTSATALDIGVLSSTNTSYGGVNSAVIQTNNGNMLFGTAGAHATQFITSGLERMRITSGGDLLLGTTSSTGGKFHMQGNYARLTDGTYTGLFGKGSDLIVGGGASDLGIRSDAAILFSYGSTERMRIDSSGNIGIGTSSPASRLEVQEGGTGSSYGITSATATGGGNAGYGFKTGGTLRWWIDTIGSAGSESLRFYSSTASAERMRIDSSGNVGIGTSSPASQLHVSSSGSPAIRVASTAGSGGTCVITAQSTGNTVFDSGSAYVFNIGSERMRIDSSGNVGIGNASAVGKLEVYQNNNSGVPAIYARQDGTAPIQTWNVAAGAERMRITSGGNVGIGTSSPSSNLVVNSSTATQFDLLTNGTRYFSAYTDASQVILGGIQNTIVSFRQNDTERMQLDTSGNLRFNSGYGSVATAYGCRAWVNFNGTGTVAIRASGNVSSITDNGTGDYTVNFTNAMPNANYAVSGATSPVVGTGYTSHIANFARTTDSIVAPTTTAYRMSTVSISTGSAIDSAYISVVIHR